MNIYFKRYLAITSYFPHVVLEMLRQIFQYVFCMIRTNQRESSTLDYACDWRGRLFNKDKIITKMIQHPKEGKYRFSKYSILV